MTGQQIRGKGGLKKTEQRGSETRGCTNLLMPQDWAMRNPATVAKFLYLSCVWCFCDMGYSTLMNHPIQQTAKKARKKELGWQLDRGQWDQSFDMGRIPSAPTQPR